jgi:protein-S-isoprenylcysteine O-methyltransferase Ste14
VRRVGLILGAALVLLGVFGVGFESGHGLDALYEHWWCLTPLVVIVLGLTSVITAYRFERHGTA